MAAQLDIEAGTLVADEAVAAWNRLFAVVIVTSRMVVAGRGAAVTALAIGAVSVCVTFGTAARYHWQRQEYRRCQVKYLFAVLRHNRL